MSGRRTRSLLAQVAPMALAACIIPDRDIEIEEFRGNPGAVRIVEPTNLTAAFLAQCADGDSTRCPQVPAGRRSGLVASASGVSPPPFCVCPEGQRDQRTIDPFYVYAEDPDRASIPERLYAVALLDLDSLTEEPQRFVAYEQHLEPGRTGESFELDQLPEDQLDPRDIDLPTGLSLLSPSLERADPGLYRFRFGRGASIGTDLCNDDNGQKLAAGIHTLQIMVTDRPFFRPRARDETGVPVVGLDGALQFEAVQYGMPDIAAGATWAIANYVFECVAEEPDTAPDDSMCACEVPEGG